MNIQLMQLRKRAGYKNRDAFAEKLGVNKHTYRSWETGAAMMSLEQAYNCAVLLGCTIDEIAGLSTPECHYSDPRQEKLNQYYEQSNDRGKIQIIEAAENAFSNLKNRLEKEGQNHSVAAMGA